jgi:hypothetical protein
MTENTEQQLAVKQPTSIGDVLMAVVQGGVTAANVDVVERMLALKEREDARQAERAFAEAFAELQKEMPRVKASKPVPGKDGTTRYTYAPYEDIMRQAQPLLAAHGFSITFDTDMPDEKRVVATCTLLHRMGHSRANKFACRIGSGPPHSSEAQGDGAAVTYAKRFALCAALNIVVEGLDTDARLESEFITLDQAEDLRQRCVASRTDCAKFLRLAQVDSFDKIPSNKLGMMDAALRKQEAKNRPPEGGK